MAGFGTMALGSGPFGYGTPVSATEPPTANTAGVRFLNPQTGDFEQNSDTRNWKQMPRSRQKVLLALKTVRGSSSALPEFGIAAPKKMGDQFEAQMRDAVRVALAHLTDVQKVIRIDDIIVEKGAGGRSRTTVVYTDTSSGIDDQVTL